MIEKKIKALNVMFSIIVLLLILCTLLTVFILSGTFDETVCAIMIITSTAAYLSTIVLIGAFYMKVENVISELRSDDLD